MKALKYKILTSVLCFLFLFAVGIITNGQEKPIFSMGLFTDCQYCDCDIKWNRYYRLSPEKLRQCVLDYNTRDISFVFDLGDFIDQNPASYDSLFPVIYKLNVPHYFVPGNHDYLQDLKLTKEKFKNLGLTQSYYTITYKNWKFIALNGNEISTYANKEGSKNEKLAQQLITKLQSEKNPNAHPWNGTISQKQFNWLHNELKKASNNNQSVIVLCHFPVFPFKSETNLLDDEKIVNELHKFSCVKAYFSGHDHEGRINQFDNILFYSFKGMVNTTENSYSVIDFYKDSLVIEGLGREKGLHLILNQKN
jgi:manganese-dependent ADP-ribose/CDP-alcohol diphosphatase